MQPLTAEKLLAVWERGRPQHPLDRALTLLAAATPNTTRDELADLSIGERDARLFSQLRTLLLRTGRGGFCGMPALRRAARVSAGTGGVRAAPGIAAHAGAAHLRWAVIPLPAADESRSRRIRRPRRMRKPRLRRLLEALQYGRGRFA